MAYRPIRPAMREGLMSTPTRSVQEAGTQTYKVGAILVYTVNGRMQEATADPTQIAGVAEEPGHNATAGTKLAAFVPAINEVIFEGTIDTSASQGNGTCVQADIGVSYGLAKDSSSGYWYVDKSDTVNVSVVITGLRDEAGTTQGRVYFRFLQSATAEF